MLKILFRNISKTKFNLKYSEICLKSTIGGIRQEWDHAVLREMFRKNGPVLPSYQAPSNIFTLFSEREIPDRMHLNFILKYNPHLKQRQSPPIIVPTAADQSNLTEESARRFDNIEFVNNQDDSLPSHLEKESIILDKLSLDLNKEDILRYYSIDDGLLQEAFRLFYKYEKSSNEIEIPKIGCKGLYDELQITNSPNLMYRECIHELREKLTEDNQCRIWLEGTRGCGKSIALASLVEWARRKNWLVMYIPSALILTNDLLFFQRKNTKKYDTPNCAKNILKSIYNIYGGDALKNIKQTTKDFIHEGDVKTGEYGETLDDLCNTGINATQSAIVCDALLKLLHEFLYSDDDIEKLIVIDNYNALYWKTGYQVSVNEKKKVLVPIGDVLIANAFRLLNIENKYKCRIVAAPTYTLGGVSTKSAVIPLFDDVIKFKIPSLSKGEIYAMLYYYWYMGLILPVEEETLLKMQFLTGGNGHEIRRVLPAL